LFRAARPRPIPSGQPLGRLRRARRWLIALKLEAAIAGLLLATFAAIHYQHALLDRTLDFSPGHSTNFSSYVYGDDTSGGTSVSTPDATDPMAWSCQLQPTYQYPFCGYGMLFDLDEDRQGLNLARFHSLTINLSYEGSAQLLRMDFKDWDDRLGRNDPEGAERVNTLEFPIRAGRQMVELNLSHFQVASWWIAENHVQPELSQPRFDNVTALNIQTGGGALPGTHRLRIHSITLHGTLLSPEQYYSGILGLWLVIVGVILFHRRGRAGDAQRREIGRWRKTLDTIPQMVWSVASEGDEYHNGQWTDFTGVVVGTADGPGHSDLIHPDDRAQVMTRWRHSLQSGEPFEAEYRMRHRSEGYRYVLSRASAERDEAGAVARWYGTCTDIHDRILAQEQARWSAKHDSMTQLPNRLVFQQELDLLTAGPATDFAVLILDVDEFKKVNDTFGHDAGDALLCTFAARLRSVVRPDDLVARLGGDEFAVILKGVRSEARVRAVADKLFASLGDPCVHQGKVIDFHASIGAGLFPRDGESKAALLKNADVALYAAKSSGRKNLKIFDASMRFDGEQRHLMIATGRAALREDMIIPYYQPKVELASGRIVGFEALLRWRDPQRGIQAPGTISAAFDDLALAAELSDRMIDRVIVDVVGWLSRGLDFHHVAVNAGAAELRAVDFAERLLERLERASIPTRCIQMEVTETVFLGRGAEYLERTLKTLSASGIRIALDDFGTGYASLSHLKAFPVDLLKIDRSFVRHLDANQEDAAIVDAVLGLGRSLRIDVIAEGIETRAQHSRLIGLGCKYGQGFLYAKPMDAGGVADLCSPGRRIGFLVAA